MGLVWHADADITPALSMCALGDSNAQHVRCVQMFRRYPELWWVFAAFFGLARQICAWSSKV